MGKDSRRGGERKAGKDLRRGRLGRTRGGGRRGRTRGEGEPGRRGVGGSRGGKIGEESVEKNWRGIERRHFLSTDMQDVSGPNYLPSGAPGSPLRMRSRVATLALSVVITCVSPSRV